MLVGLVSPSFWSTYVIITMTASEMCVIQQARHTTDRTLGTVVVDVWNEKCVNVS